MKRLIKSLRAIYSPNGGACRPDTKTPACEAGVNEDQKMVISQVRSVSDRRPNVASKGGIESTIEGLVFRSADGMVTIAPGIAEQVLNSCNFEGQRKRKPGRVAKSLRRIESGAWDPEASTIVFARTPDGRLHLIEGQHRMAAISESGIATSSYVRIRAADDMQGVRRMYAQYDEPDSSRNDSEMLDGLQVADSIGVTKRVASAAFRAMTLLRTDLEPQGPSAADEARSRDGRLEEITGWVDEIRQFARIFDTADPALKPYLLAQGTMAPSLYLLRHQPVKAREFLFGLAKNDGLRRSDPRSRLISDFQTRGANKGSMRQGVARMSIAWNAFWRGRDVQIIRIHERAVIQFLGTPKVAKR